MQKHNRNLAKILSIVLEISISQHVLRYLTLRNEYSADCTSSQSALYTTRTRPEHSAKHADGRSLLRGVEIRYKRRLQSPAGRPRETRCELLPSERSFRPSAPKLGRTISSQPVSLRRGTRRNSVVSDCSLYDSDTHHKSMCKAKQFTEPELSTNLVEQRNFVK
jgi:hypothetical protein